MSAVSHWSLLAEQIEAVNERIDSLKAKRAMLRARLLETTVVDAAAFMRTGPNGDQVMEWVHDAIELGRGLKVTGVRDACLEGMGLSLGDYSKLKWDRDNCWPAEQKHGGGPCEWSTATKWPRHGPTVYALFDETGRMSYIGRTIDFRNRVKAHRKEKGPTAVHTWEAWSCETEAEMCDLEAILITQHDPCHNKRYESRNGAAV